jgi:hypothetical protein
VNEHDAIARIKRLSHNINCADEITEVIERLIKERDEAWLKIGSIRNEIDCRIQHGADSNGHLEAILKMIDKDE